MTTIGYRIKQIRKINNMTQMEFSKMLGISQGTLSEIEQGKNKPAVESLEALFVHCHTDLNWLIMGNKDRSHSCSSDLKAAFFEKISNLHINDQKEILEFIEFKLQRRGSVPRK